MASPKKSSWTIKPRLRIARKADVAFGPGKAELLELVAETGSIREAAKRMDMSYMRAWSLIQTMNASFSEPVVLTARGGQSGGGGAELTETGRKVLALYQQMEEASLVAVEKPWNEFQQLLGD